MTTYLAMGKFCNVVEKPVNKGLGMLQMLMRNGTLKGLAAALVLPSVPLLAMSPRAVSDCYRITRKVELEIALVI
jgi:hypothetical protein